MKTKRLLLALIIVVTMAHTVTAEQLNEGNPSKAVGYYHSEDTDIILLANGTGFSVDDSSEDLLDGPIDFSVYYSGDDYILAADDSFALFREQKEKGKNENGGVYYAVYEEFIGMEEETDFDEGRQIRFGEYVFSNDYIVFEKDPLMTFFGENIGVSATGRMEGNGFESPEDALGAYIQGLKDNDIDAMIAVFAVETYAENYSLIKMVDRMRAYQPTIGYIPNVSDYSIRLNVEKRRSEIINAIRNNYLVLQGSRTVIGEDAYIPIMMKNEHESASDLVDSLFVTDDSSFLGTIEFDNEFYDPAKLSDHYSTENNRENMKRQMAVFGGEDITSVVAKFYSNGKPVVLTADAVKYDDRWYLCTMGGNIGNIMGLSSYLSGMIPLQFDEEGDLAEFFGEYSVYESIYEAETEY